MGAQSVPLYFTPTVHVLPRLSAVILP